MQLPVEIIEEILSWYCGYDRETLLACSLVSKVWTPVVQRRVFSSLHADFELSWEYKPVLRRLHRTLNRSSHLSRYFREVTLDLWSFRALPKAYDEHLPCILRRFEGVKHLHIMGKVFYLEEFSDSMIRSLHTLVSNRHFVKLEFSRVDFKTPMELLSLLRECRMALRELVFSGSEIQREWERGTLQSVELPRLEKLELVVGDTLFQLVDQEALHMPSLLSQTLKIDLAQPYRPTIPNFIPRTIPSLSFNIGSHIIPYAQPRSIHSFVPQTPDVMPPAFVLPDFRPFKNLRRIAVSTIFTPEDGSTALSRIARFFDYADPENLEKLEELSISTSLEANQDGLVYPYDWDLPTWKDLDSRLASLIGTLRQVMIHINGYKPYYQETGTAQLVKLDDVVELLESQFVKLRKADIFKLVATR